MQQTHPANRFSSVYSHAHLTATGVFSFLSTFFFVFSQPLDEVYFVFKTERGGGPLICCDQRTYVTTKVAKKKDDEARVFPLDEKYSFDSSSLISRFPVFHLFFRSVFVPLVTLTFHSHRCPYTNVIANIGVEMRNKPTLAAPFV